MKRFYLFLIFIVLNLICALSGIYLHGKWKPRDVLCTHPSLCHINIKTIDVVPLPTGNYTVSLEDNGIVLDSKTLVVQ